MKEALEDMEEAKRQDEDSSDEPENDIEGNKRPRRPSNYVCKFNACG